MLLHSCWQGISQSVLQNPAVNPNGLVNVLEIVLTSACKAYIDTIACAVAQNSRHTDAGGLNISIVSLRLKALQTALWRMVICSTIILTSSMAASTVPALSDAELSRPAK